MSSGGEAGRRRIPGRTGRRDWMWAAAMGGIALVVVLGVILTLSSGSGSTGPTIAGIPCERGEKLQYHVHAHLALVMEGQEVAVPPEIGVKENCIYWLHTHSADGIIHVEAPARQDFTLGQFFQIWEQPLTASALLDRTPDAQHEVQAWVNGERFQGDPASIPLEDKTSIVLEYGPPFAPPPEFIFP